MGLHSNIINSVCDNVVICMLIYYYNFTKYYIQSFKLYGFIATYIMVIQTLCLVRISAVTLAPVSDSLTSVLYKKVLTGHLIFCYEIIQCYQLLNIITRTSASDHNTDLTIKNAIHPDCSRTSDYCMETTNTMSFMITRCL